MFGTCRTAEILDAVNYQAVENEQACLWCSGNMLCMGCFAVLSVSQTVVLMVG